MRKYEEWMWGIRHRIGCYTPLYIIIVLIIIFLCCSCATRTKVEYVDREVVRYETKIEHDTLINNIHDSIFHSIIQKGDTIYNTKYIEKIRYKDRIVERIDTFYRDSIMTQYKEKVIEKRYIPKWCYFCLGGCLVLILVSLYKFAKWLKII